MKDFIKAIMAGISISLGGIIYFSLDNLIMGSLLFSIGIFTIYTFGFNLYTGKVCDIPYEKPSYLLHVVLVFLGNAVGAVGMGYLLRYTKQAKLIEKASATVEGKLSDTLFSTLIMGIMCGIIMCIVVKGFKSIKDSVGKYFALTIPIMVFILSGYEHSVANLFYFSFANAWTAKSVLYLLVAAFGNMLGGMFIPLVMYKLDGVKIGRD